MYNRSQFRSRNSERKIGKWEGELVILLELIQKCFSNFSEMFRNRCGKKLGHSVEVGRANETYQKVRRGAQLGKPERHVLIA